MKTKKFKKEYIGVLDGKLLDLNGTIDAPIARKSDSIIERCVDFENGDKSITYYKILKATSDYSIVHFILGTGRTHQIRVHSAYIGHPIIGDTLYGNKSEQISRQALHAYRISFIHPISKKEMVLESDVPEDMRIFF